ncbi:acyl-CoA-binding protein [Niabella terrae]
MEIQQQFETAVAASKTLSEKPSNMILLQLYALYKQATEGDINVEPPANPFDIVAKAKYEAWTEQKGSTNEEAMQAYIALVDKLKTGN